MASPYYVVELLEQEKKKFSILYNNLLKEQRDHENASRVLQNKMDDLLAKIGSLDDLIEPRTDTDQKTMTELANKLKEANARMEKILNG